MNRETNIRNLNLNDIWDVIVVGGGASGLGAAVDAASRGYKTILLEEGDFASATSSRSTKLVHGGVRYLEQGEVALVLEALKERGLFLKNAPHLVDKQEFVVPNYEWWDAPYYTIGLKVYDMMSGKYGFGDSEHINKKQAIEKLPNLAKDELSSGVIYYDGRFDDARMAITLAQTVNDKGGVVLNYMRVTGLKKNKSGMVKGVKALDLETGEEYSIKSRVVINACGVFSDNILRMDDPVAEKSVISSRGVHIVVDKKFLASNSAIMIPKTSDGRVLFAVPWHGKVIIGTTDTETENPVREPQATDEEIDFILENCRRYFENPPERSDILSVYAGLRPLASPEMRGKKTKDISRNHSINVSLAGLVSIIGGKWTTYRKIGEDAVNSAIMVGGLKERESITAQLPLHGFMMGLEADDYLRWYGSDALKVRSIMDRDSSLREKIHPDYPYTAAEVVWAARHEMARNIGDFLARRIRLLFFDAKAAIEAAPMVADIMAKEFGYRRKWKITQVEEFEKLAQNYLLKPID